MGSFKWLTESNRWKHLVLAICIGLWANPTVSGGTIYKQDGWSDFFEANSI